jgi:site-specific DNA-methyltransferase (adenine-specific)
MAEQIALNIDCMEFMKTLPDKTFDLAIVDPPYGIKIKARKNRKDQSIAYKKVTWDNDIPSAGYFEELFRISKNQIIWGANYFVEHLHKGTKGWIVWYKGQEGLTMSDCELAFSSFNVPTRIKTINRFELAREGVIHPTQKPIKLYEWLLSNYAHTGDRILDTHLGSGSSRIAAFKLGFDFVGCELDRDFFDLQEKRFNEFIAKIHVGIDTVRKLQATPNVAEILKLSNILDAQ